MVKQLLGVALLMALAGCSSAPTSGRPSPEGPAPATASPTPALNGMPVTPSPASPDMSTVAPIPTGTPNGLVGLSFPQVRETLTAQGLVEQHPGGPLEPPGVVFGSVEETGLAVVVGDPVSTLGWRVREPFLDLSPLRAVLSERGLDQVARWIDEHLDGLWGIDYRAEGFVSSLPVLLVVRYADDNLHGIDFVMGDVGPLAEWDIAIEPTPTPHSIGLEESMVGYGQLAETTNEQLVLALATLLDTSAAVIDRTDAARQARQAEEAFATGLAALPFPESATEAASALAAASNDSLVVLEALAGATDSAAIDAAIPSLLEALNDESQRAAILRESLLSHGLVINDFDAEPPVIGAASSPAPPGALEIASWILHLSDGDGEVSVVLRNPEAALAFGVELNVAIVAYEGPVVTTLTFRIEAVPSGGTASVSQALVGLNQGGLTPQEMEIEVLSVDEWRAPFEPTIAGR
jgi:hypothetical protein